MHAVWIWSSATKVDAPMAQTEVWRRNRYPLVEIEVP
uniref:Uncharacterized protein n=1 Tax=Arundo donax TaxID=35708 RepID=A0A0A9A1H8_ARUDO